MFDGTGYHSNSVMQTSTATYFCNSCRCQSNKRRVMAVLSAQHHRKAESTCSFQLLHILKRMRSSRSLSCSGSRLHLKFNLMWKYNTGPRKSQNVEARQSHTGNCHQWLMPVFSCNWATNRNDELAESIYSPCMGRVIRNYVKGSNNHLEIWGRWPKTIIGLQNRNC